MKIKKCATILFISTVAACNQSNTTSFEKKMEMSATRKDTVKNSFANLVFGSKKDLVCGMPVSAGVKDTMRYKGKIYGFCAAECKAEFIKSPKTYLTAKK